MGKNSDQSRRRLGRKPDSGPDSGKVDGAGAGAGARSGSEAEGGQPTPAEAGRHLIRSGLKAALATLDRASGHPSASLITVATLADNRPIFLISGLAVHTANLKADPRASLLLDGTGGLGDPLTGGRLTLIGEARPTSDGAARARFLARHPSAELYVDFGDFAFYRLEVERAHYVGGFGRIADIEAADLRTDTANARELLAAEPDIVQHMNADHADAVELYATRLCGGPPGTGLPGTDPPVYWRMSGIDPAGIDLVMNDQARRLDFAAPIATPGEARKVLAALADEARGVGGRSDP